jgi:hypothetical protein
MRRKVGGRKHTIINLIITRVSACAPVTRLDQRPTFPDVAAT